MKRIIRSKKIMFMSILIMLSLTLGLTYSAFVINTNQFKASEMLITELIYEIHTSTFNLSVP